MKHLDPNDPRFTAKALGEEEPLDIHPEAKDEFEDIQSFAETLKSELKVQDEKEALTAEQKERVRVAIQPNKRKFLKFPIWINAVAACLVLGLVGIFSFKIVQKANRPLLSEGIDHLRTPVVEIDNIRINTQASGRVDYLEGDQNRRTDVAREPVAELAQSDSQMIPLRLTAQPKKENKPVTPSAVLAGESEESIRGQAAQTLSGTRVRSELKDFDAPIVVLNEFLDDKGVSDLRTKQVYKSSAEVAEFKLAFSQPTAERKIDSFDQFSKNPPVIQQQEPWNREAYDRIVENAFKSPADHPLSTFSIDVDTASYANMRRYLHNNQLPPADAIRIEELINYFSYDYAGPDDETPFAVHVDSASAPWNENHRLVRIALQGEKIDLSERPDANLVFLIDVSGSMSDQNKLPLVQRSMNLLVDQMEARDRIAVVVYAGASGLALPSTTANDTETIQHAISNLKSGGSTNGGAGIELAYSVAQKHFVTDGINRVILCTDGDFNVGTSDRGGLTRLIEEKAKTGVFFSVLGFGKGNYQDATMEELSNKGNGNYGYVDSFKEARKVFVDDMLGTLFTIAKDVKIQVEFNPTHVGSYRLIGYENRMLPKEDFNDDNKDAGEIGAGHRVTALYEVVPVGLTETSPTTVDPLKYQTESKPAVKSSELLTVKLRYKEPDENASKLIEKPFIDSDVSFANASDDFRFASTVATFGMLLRNSEYAEDMSFAEVLDMASEAKGNDSGGLRSEFIELVEKAIALTPEKEEVPANPEPQR